MGHGEGCFDDYIHCIMDGFYDRMVDKMAEKMGRNLLIGTGIVCGGGLWARYVGRSKVQMHTVREMKKNYLNWLVKR